MAPLGAAAQELRPYGSPAYWLNQTDNDRLPIRERQLQFLEGITGPRLPSPKREGLTPRLGFGVEARRKSTGAGDSDTIVTLTPGFAFLRRMPRLTISGDLTWESAQHFDQEAFSDVLANLSTDAQLVYALDDRNQLSAFAGYARLRDTGDAVLSGLVPSAAQVTVRNTTLTWSHELDWRRLLDFGIGNVHATTDQPGVPDVTTNSLSLLFGQAVNARDLLEAELLYDRVAFEGSSTEDVFAATARYTRDLSDRLSLRGELGVLDTSAAGGRSYPTFGAALIHTARNARYELSAERELISVPGIDGLILTDLLRGATHLRLDHGLQLQGALEWQELRGLGPAVIDSQVTSLDLGLSYAVDRNTWLWTRLRANEERSGGQRQTDTRVYFGISRSFD